MDRTEYRLRRPVINGRPSATWYIIHLDERGRTRRVSTRTEDKRSAEQVLARYVAARHAPPDEITIDWILDQYVQDLENRDSKSLDRITSHLRAVRQAFGVLGPASLSHNHVQTATARWRKSVSNGTVRTRLLYLRAGLGWAVRSGIIEDAPHIPAPPPGAPRERYLTRDEFVKLYQAADEPHLRTFLALGVWSGLRNGAILSLTWDDIDRRAMLIRPKGGSPNKKRAIVRINTALAIALGRAWTLRDGPYVVHWQGEQIGSVKRSFKRAVRVAGLEDVQIHDLRKTCASWLAMNGVPMDRIAMILGDSVSITAKHYAHLSPDYLRDEMEGLI